MTARQPDAPDSEREILIRRLREGHCSDNMGCGTMKMCVCATASDAADYLSSLSKKAAPQVPGASPSEAKDHHLSAAALSDRGRTVGGAAVELLARLYQWDMMDTAADGKYWRAEIDKVLGNGATAPNRHADLIADLWEAATREGPEYEAELTLYGRAAAALERSVDKESERDYVALWEMACTDYWRTHEKSGTAEEAERVAILEVVAAVKREAQRPSGDTPTFEQIRDAIVVRMGGHTISERDGPAYNTFIRLLRMVTASECGMTSAPSSTATPSNFDPVERFIHLQGPNFPASFLTEQDRAILRKVVDEAVALSATRRTVGGAAVALLGRLYQWDMMDTAADGKYWREEIDKVLSDGAASDVRAEGTKR